MNTATKKSSGSATQIYNLDEGGDSALEVQESTTITGSAHDDALSGAKVAVTVFQQEGEAGHEAVFVSVNGIGYQIPRDVRSTVPVEVMHALENCVLDINESLPNGDSKKKLLRRFNFTNHGPVA